MAHIAIISSSIREGRLSHRVALFLKRLAEQREGVTAEILDLAEYNFPLFTERLAFNSSPSDKVLDFTTRMTAADGVIIVSPVYNASFPASLKNIIDLYIKEWRRKCIGIATVTAGPNAAIATAKEIQALMLRMGAIVSPTAYTPTNTAAVLDSAGIPLPEANAEKFAAQMLDEFLWLTEKIK